MPMRNLHMPAAIDRTNPAHWLPWRCLEAMEGRRRLYIDRNRATWPDLLAARALVVKELDRARKYRYRRALGRHELTLVVYDRVCEAFAPLMQYNPTLTFAEACQRQTQHPLQRVVEL